MQQEDVQAHWKGIRSDLQRVWRRITTKEWDQTKGSMTAVSQLIQNKYGLDHEDIETRLHDIYNRYTATSSLKKFIDSNLESDTDTDIDFL